MQHFKYLHHLTTGKDDFWCTAGWKQSGKGSCGTDHPEVTGKFSGLSCIRLPALPRSPTPNPASSEASLETSQLSRQPALFIGSGSQAAVSGLDAQASRRRKSIQKRETVETRGLPLSPYPKLVALGALIHCNMHLASKTGLSFQCDFFFRVTLSKILSLTNRGSKEKGETWGRSMISVQIISRNTCLVASPGLTSRKTLQETCLILNFLLGTFEKVKWKVKLILVLYLI